MTGVQTCALPIYNVRRAEVNAALNRLDQNFKIAKDKLSKDDRFNIGSLKEFIAEAFTNSEFQTELAKLEQKGLGRTIKNLFDSIVRNITLALRTFGTDEHGAKLQEVLTDIASIISLPSGKLKGTEVSYAAKKAPDTSAPITLDSNNDEYNIKKDDKKKD